MKYLLAVIFPPLAVLACGKPGQALLNVVLSISLYIPGLIHALCVVGSTEADARNERLIEAVNPEIKLKKDELRSQDKAKRMALTQTILYIFGGLFAFGMISGGIRSCSNALHRTPETQATVISAPVYIRSVEQTTTAEPTVIQSTPTPAPTSIWTEEESKAYFGTPTATPFIHRKSHGQ